MLPITPKGGRSSEVMIGRSNPASSFFTLLSDRLPVPSRFVVEFVWRSLRLNEDIGSGSEVNRLVSELVC